MSLNIPINQQVSNFNDKSLSRLLPTSAIYRVLEHQSGVKLGLFPNTEVEIDIKGTEVRLRKR